MVISSLLFIASTAWTVKAAQIAAPKVAGAPAVSRSATRVMRGNEPFADLWFIEQRASAKTKDTDRVNFGALADGSAVGILRLHKAWRDYRDRSVPPGTYLLSYAIQPRLKDHAGTSAYRDFLLLAPSPPGQHPFVMSIVPSPFKHHVVIPATAGGLRVGLVIEGTGELGM